ncbi:MAG TPA: PDZ domain-containing protein [Candidatus Methylomirabilis sp.]|nr:PDZ domain-containing protein [Candidatus Methylomirabilis sp.]
MKSDNILKIETKKQLSVSWFFVASIIFGLAGGLIALLITRSYFSAALDITPTVENLNNSQNNLRQATMLIESAKKIIVGQQNNVTEAISSSQNTIVGIFKKIDGAATTSNANLTKKNFNLSDYYNLGGEVGEGLVMTSDGWILAAPFSKIPLDNSTIKNFVIITRNQDIYNIDQIKKTGIDSYFFLHLRGAKDLPVKGFVNNLDISSGQSLVVLDWEGDSYLSSIVKKNAPSEEIRNSDVATDKFFLANDLNQFFSQAFIFNFNGEIVGFFDNKSGFTPLNGFRPLIRELGGNIISQRPSLGVNYVNLEDFAIKYPGYEKGALIRGTEKIPSIKAGSVAATAGLREGDVIISVDNSEIDSQHDLADIIQKYYAGDQINIIYRRAGADNSLRLKLDALP